MRRRFDRRRTAVFWNPRQEPDRTVSRPANAPPQRGWLKRVRPSHLILLTAVPFVAYLFITASTSLYRTRVKVPGNKVF